MPGMFEKDKEIGLILTRAFDKGEHFVLFGARIAREDFPTSLGPSPQAVLSVAKIDNPRERFDVTTLASAIVTKVREAVDEDFPARVFWTTTFSDKWSRDVTVLQFVSPYGGGSSVPQDAPPAAQATADEDIPF